MKIKSKVKKWILIIFITTVALITVALGGVMYLFHFGVTKRVRLEAADEYFSREFQNNLVITENSQWRGDGRNGVYHETDLLKTWRNNTPDLLWTYEGLGNGYTSAAVANERLYITGLLGERVFLFVFDLNGVLLAKKDVCYERTTAYPGPRSTVCVNDGKLYIYTALGKLHCLDEATLETVWTKYLFEDFDGANIRWGTAESPLIVGDKIFMTPGGATHNMVALNKHTGALIWSASGLGTPSSYCSPQFIDGYAAPIVVTNTHEHIIAFNANTGEMLWAHPQKNQRNIHPNTPFYSNGMILSTTGYKGGTLMLRLKDGGKAVEQVWKNDADNQIGGVVKIGDYAYTTGHNNRGFYCMDWNTGEIKYRVNNHAACAIVAADGMIYCYSDKGDMLLVKPNPDRFDVVSRFKITLGTNEHWAHPVIHHGVMYVRHGDALMAYKIK